MTKLKITIASFLFRTNHNEIQSHIVVFLNLKILNIRLNKWKHNHRSADDTERERERHLRLTTNSILFSVYCSDGMRFYFSFSISIAYTRMRLGLHLMLINYNSNERIATFLMPECADHMLYDTHGRYNCLFVGVESTPATLTIR